MTSVLPITDEEGMLGDAMGEVVRFYDDYAFYVNSGNPWSLRGGFYEGTSAAGVFSYDEATGVDFPFTNFRISLIP